MLRRKLKGKNVEVIDLASRAMIEDIFLYDMEGCCEPVILHTDQDSVYATYNELIQDSVIVRSMSRAGKPTDNPVNEALNVPNQDIKEELYMDFKCIMRENELPI